MAAEDVAVFYERAYPGAKRLAHLLLSGASAADDAVRDAFTRLHRDVADVTDLDRYLRAAVVDCCLGATTRWRPPAETRVAQADGPIEIPDPLLDAVAELPAAQRVALVLRYWDELPETEIGTALAASPSGVRSLIRVGLEALGGDDALERDLRDAFSIEARNVPLPDPQWSGPRRAPPASGRRRRPLTVVAAVAMLAVAIAVTWPRASPEGVMHADPRPSSGLADVGLRRISPGRLAWAPSPFAVGPIRPGSFRAYQRGDDQFVTYETIETRPGAMVVEVWCVEAQRLVATCFPTDFPHRQARQFSRMLIWLDLPPGTAFVVHGSGGVWRWQRARGRTVAFVSPGDPEAELVALDVEGAELARFADTTIVAIGTVLAGDVVTHDSLDDAGNRAVSTAATASALQCLGGAGLDGDPRRPVPVGVEVDAVWRDCVGSARAAAAAVFDQLGGRLVENARDDPSVLSG